MYTAITQGIHVIAFSEYEEFPSDPEANRYFFRYTVRIENHSEHTVQLLRRHWIIFDSDASMRQVEGPGVVGKTPTLQPGETYEYLSACDLDSAFGTMRGQYMMENKTTEELFYVEIPRFLLEVPWKLN